MKAKKCHFSFKSKQKFETTNDEGAFRTPLDLNFNIHQCIYLDDNKLPVWKLFGNLPLIDIGKYILTDEKLEQINKLTKRIPLPASKKYNDLADTRQIQSDKHIR